MSGSSGQNFSIRLTLDGKELVLSGIGEVQARAIQASSEVAKAGESTGRALAVIERGTQVASAGLTKLGGDFAALAPIVENAGGAVGRLVTLLSSGAGLAGTLGAVGIAVTAVVTAYQNWDSISRALNPSIETNRVAVENYTSAMLQLAQVTETAIDRQQRLRSEQAASLTQQANTVISEQRELLRQAERDASRYQPVLEQVRAARAIDPDFQPSGAVARRLADLDAANERAAEARRRIAALEERRDLAVNFAQRGGEQYGPPAPTPDRTGGGGGSGRSSSAARAENDALRDREALVQRNLTADERYTQGLERIAALNDRLIAQGNDPLPDETIQREATRLMEEYESATRRAAQGTRNLADGTKELEQAGRGAAKALTGAFEDLVFNGETFDDTLKNLERSLLRLGNQYLLNPLFERGFNALLGTGGSGGSGGAIGGLVGSLLGSSGGSEIAGAGVGLLKTATTTALFHEGGVIGVGGRAGPTVPLSLFADAPRFHAGGIIGPDERPIIAQVGERVLTRQQAADYAQGGAVTININGVQNPDEFRRSQSQIAAAMTRFLSRSGRSR